MYKCADCGQPMLFSEAVIDHIVPKSQGGTNDLLNLRIVHRNCLKRGWLATQWVRFRLWLDSWKPCPKEQGGYTCRHRTMRNGQKECGTERNYWKGDNE